MFWSLAPATVHSPQTSALLSVTKDTEHKVSLREFVELRCPSLSVPFKPVWWLFNGHLQTMYNALGDFSHVGEVIYERRYLELLDGGTLGLDFTGPRCQDEIKQDAPIVVVAHGLTGGSYEPYVRSIISVTCASVHDGGLGYRGVVVNFRGCANVPVTSPQLYSAGHTEDLRTALLYLSLTYPSAKLLGLGFSLGANVMTRYLGEEGPKSKLTSGCVLACPWNIPQNSSGFEASFFSRNVYSKTMGRNFRRVFLKGTPGMKNLHDRLPRADMQWVLQHERFTLAELDEHVIRFIGGSSPPFPFPSAVAYMKWASSDEHIKTIRVPFVAFNALDDPIVNNVPVPLPDEATHTLIVTTDKGGHLGWFQRPTTQPGGLWQMEQWTRRPVCEWIKATAEDLLDSRNIQKEDTEVVNGFVISKSNPSIGYREQFDLASEIVSNKNMPGLVAGL